MEFLIRLIELFLEEEKTNTILLFVLCVIVNLIQTNAISSITANIITHIKGGGKNSVYGYIHLFVGVSILYLVFYHLYKIVQINLITKLRQWTRNELIKLVLLNNNENYSEKSFMELDSPIARMSTVSFMLFNDIITFVIPTLIFLLIITGYVFFVNVYLGIFFVIANILIVIYPYLTVNEILSKNRDYENSATGIEFYILEILNNMDKIIFRGQTFKEIEKISEMSSVAALNAYIFYATTINHSSILSVFIYTIMFTVIYVSAYLYLDKKITLTLFITLFSIIILYREKMGALIQNISDFIEFYGRINTVINHFEDMDMSLTKPKEYPEVQLMFDKIKFENVTFKYKSTDKYVFKNLNLSIETNNKIVGICGLSGRGKSTFAKLLLKIYNNYDGNIYIDNTNVKDVDANYIRYNITFINQNSKLFDRKTIENMMYGCIDEEHCNHNLNTILNSYPKIKGLFQDVDIYNKKSGSLGENLSGGQRQVVNVISGLINPSKILILDEPTNALDPSLKKEMLQLIDDFRKYKKCIIIITHDKEVHYLFNQKIDL
jgi:ABC-type multidrug transport system fused ATPase/permease subunit